jgi:hypothetical protein
METSMKLNVKIAGPLQMLVFVVALAGSTASPSHAQQHSYPHAVSGREVDNWAQELGLTAAERLEMEPFVKSYRAKFKQINQRINMRPAQMLMQQGDVAGAKASLKERRATIQESQVLDDRLLHDVAAFAARSAAGAGEASDREAALARVQTVMMGLKREREMWRLIYCLRGAMMTTAGVGSDPLSLVSSLPEEVLDAVDEPSRQQLIASMPGYRDRRLAAMRELVEMALTREVRLTQEELAKLKPRTNADGTPLSPDEQKANQAARKAIREAVDAEIRAQRGKVMKIDREYLKQIKTILPEPTHREWWNMYLRNEYNTVGPDRDSIEPLVKRILAIDGLTAQQNADVQRVLSAWRRAHDEKTEAMLEAWDEDPTASRLGLIMVREGEAQQVKAWQQLGEERRALNDSARTQLQAALGDSWERVSRDPEAATTGSQPIYDPLKPPSAAEQGSGGRWGGDRIMSQGGEFKAPAITPAEVERAGTWMGLDESRQSIVAQLHEDYRSNYEAIAESTWPSVAIAGEETFDLTTDDGMQSHIAGVEARWAGLKSAIERLRTVDEQFLKSIEPLLAGEAEQWGLERFRRARMRQFHNRGYEPDARVDEEMRRHPARADLVDVVERSALSEKGLAAIHSILDEYEVQFIELLRARFAIQLQTQSEMRLAQAKGMMRNRPAEEYQVLILSMGDASNRLHDADTPVKELNLRTAPVIKDALPGLDARAFNQAWCASVLDYQRYCKGESVILAVIDFDDLSPEQRIELLELLQTQIADLDAVTGPMIALMAQRRLQGYVGRSPSIESRREEERRQNELMWLEDDQLEVEYAAYRSLKAILTPEQIARVPELQPKVKSERARHFLKP